MEKYEKKKKKKKKYKPDTNYHLELWTIEYREHLYMLSDQT